MLCNRKDACFLCMPNYHLSVVKLSQPTPGQLKCSVMTTVKEEIVPSSALGLEKGDQLYCPRLDQSEITEARSRSPRMYLLCRSLTVYLLFFVCWPLKDRASCMLVVGYPCMHDGKAASPAILSTQSPHSCWNDINATFVMDSCYNTKNIVFK